MLQAQVTTPQDSKHRHLRPEMDAAQDVYEALWGELKHNLLQFNQASTNPLREQIYWSMAYRLRQLNEVLEESADYLYALHLAQHRSSNADPWVWKLLADDGEMALGLLTIEADNNTPLHSHPGHSGAGLVLSGTVVVDQFDQQTLAFGTDYPIVKLKPNTSDYYKTGQMAAYSCEQGNIQRLQAITERSVVLTAKLRCGPQRQAYWYYPISPESLQNSFFAKSLVRLTPL